MATAASPDDADPVPSNTGEIRLEAGQIALEADQIALEADQIALEADQIALEADQIARKADRIALEADRIALEADRILLGENLQLLPRLEDESFQLVYIDPPFNTGKAQQRSRLQTVADEHGDRRGFQGRRYATKVLSRLSYVDAFDDYLAFLEPRLRQAWRVLRADGTLYVHLDYREAHYCKVLLDEIFGRECFLNEIVWAYDYGARSRRRWPAKHDTILVYVKDRARYFFDCEGVDREPYMAPGLVTVEKAARGKLPTDVWWHTIVPTTGSERTGYPTQKPEGVVRRIVQASSRPGDWCLDFFAGSGTLGAVAQRLGRRYVLIDSNPQAVAIMRERLGARPAARVADRA